MGTLYVVATPIGNLEDVTLRAIRILLTTQVIACEDTRRTGQLIKVLADRWLLRMGLNPLRLRRFISVRDWNEAQMVPRVLAELAQADVALVSDAGTPLISDPGYKIVKAAKEAGYKVSPIPGPSAVLAALSVAGLPTNRFIFWGFVKRLPDLEPGFTHVFFASPHRLTKFRQALLLKYPTAKVVLAHELTKIHEQVTSLAPESPPRGEAVVLLYLSE